MEGYHTPHDFIVDHMVLSVICAGILFREALDNLHIGGAPLGFWFAQNGAIYIFLALIVVYCRKMTQYEKIFGIKG